MLHDDILGTIGNTPVVRINKLAPPHVTMYVKCEAFNPMASVKDRLAIAIIEDAERRGTLKPGQTVVEATSGNTGIALAMVCAVKGYPFVAVMADSFSIERRKLMRALGAKVVLTPARGARKRHGEKDRGAGEGAGLVHRAAVREPGEPGVPPQHDGAGDPARLRRQAPRLLGHGLRHRRHSDGRGRDAEEGAAGDQDHRRRSRQGRRSSRGSRGSPTRSRGGLPTSSRRC